MGAGMRRNSSIFQSTLPQGERLFGIYSRQRYCFISIHAPARGATLFSRAVMAINDISIHAPARGATKKNEYKFKGLIISIHAPARGATLSIQ